MRMWQAEYGWYFLDTYQTLWKLVPTGTHQYPFTFVLIAKINFEFYELLMQDKIRPETIDPLL